MLDTAPTSNKLVIGTPSTYAGPSLEMQFDRLTLTYATKDESERKNIRSSLMDAKTDGFATLVKYGSSNKRYRINAHLHTKTGGSFLFQADPKKPAEPFVRIDGNPCKCGPEGIAELKFCSEPMFVHGWNSILTKARVSRYDVALDVHGVHISDLIVSPSSCMKSFVVLGQAGQPQTIYYGSNQSRAMFRVYDKAQHLKDTKGIAGCEPWTRIERSVRTGIPLASIGEIANPFSKLHVTDLSFDVTGLPQGLLALFKIAQRSYGASACLALLPKVQRKAIRDAMKAHACDWWMPEVFWKAWKGQLHELGILTNAYGVHALDLKPGIHFGGA